MKNTKSIIVFLVMAFLLVAGMAVIVNYNSSDNSYDKEANPNTITNPETTAPVSTNTTNSYTLAEVSTHTSASSCWSIVGSNVYDLTSWISKHPGGKKAIIGLCGKDGTAAFTGQHGGQKRPESELKGFSIGTYKQ